MKTYDDIFIDKLIKGASVSASENFTESTISAIRNLKAEQTHADALVDALLKKPAAINSDGFADGVLSSISYSKGVRIDKIASWVTGISVAACAALAIFWSAPSNSGVLTESDFAQMSQVADEIAALSTLIAQEEFLDIIRF